MQEITFWGEAKMLSDNIHYQHFFPICQMSSLKTFPHYANEKLI